MLLETEVDEWPSWDRSSEGPTLRHVGSATPASRPEPQWRRAAPLRSRRLSPLLLMAAGLAVSSLAVLVLVTRLAPSFGPPPAPGLSGVVIGGPSDVAAQMATYAPGQSSGWHAHTGLHAVVVVSGTLTIVDGECQRHTYGPGDSYVGGREVHLALNDTAAPVEIAITYMFPAGISHTAFHVVAAEPSGCGSSR